MDVERCGRCIICGIYGVFLRRNEESHDNPQDSYLLSRGLNSGPPEYKTGVSITGEPFVASVTSCVLPKFKHTTLLIDTILYHRFKNALISRSVLSVCSKRGRFLNIVKFS
jgi:hypothetical protein